MDNKFTESGYYWAVSRNSKIEPEIIFVYGGGRAYTICGDDVTYDLTKCNFTLIGPIRFSEKIDDQA